MPERAVYDQAILLAKARLKVPDQELTHGVVEKFTVQTVAGSMERPWGIEGGFAVVYKFRTQSGKMRALRCFRVPINPDIQFRYERIGTYFAKHAPTITATFNYYSNGIVVKENVQGQQQSVTYPVIEMEWINGATLLEYVDELCRKRDRARLENLASQWLDMLRVLREAHISHGDFAGVNVMVRDNGALVLIDYDGVYVPEFTTAGLQQLVLGQADYQHPQMATRPFNEYTDDFSALVIYVALIALQAKPELWDKYTQRDPSNGKLKNMNILFAHADFVDPQRSILIHDLEKIHEPRLKSVLQALVQACQLPVEQVRFPEALADPDRNKKVALATLEQAIRDDDNERIVNAWVAILKTYAPAQVHAGRVTQAEQILQALKRFRDALKTQQLQQIIAAYDATVLDTCKQVKQDERACLVLAQNFIEALNGDDDQAIVGSVDEIQASVHRNVLVFTQQEQQRITLAQQRKRALLTFRIALMNRRSEQIVTAYNAAVLDTCKSLTHDERELLLLAQNLIQAYQSDDDRAIITAADAIHNSIHRTRLLITVQEQQRVELARQREIALIKLRAALANKKIQPLAAAYDSILDTSASVTQEERELVRLAKKFVLAYHKEDDQALGAVHDDYIQNASYQKYFIFTTQEQQRIALVQQRNVALQTFRQALASKNIQQIAATYLPLVQTSKNVTAEEHTLGHLVQDFVLAYKQDDDQALVNANDEIQRTALQRHLVFTPEEQQRITIAQQRKTALMKFRMAVMGKRAQQIALAYDPVLQDSKNMTQAEREQLTLASDFLRAYQQDDDIALVEAWDEIQNFSFRLSFVFTVEEQQRVDLARQRKIALMKLRMALLGKSIAAIATAYDAVLETSKNITPEEREKATLARGFLQAYQSRNDPSLLSAWTAIQKSAYRLFFVLTEQEQQRVRQAQQGGPSHA